MGHPQPARRHERLQHHHAARAAQPVALAPAPRRRAGGGAHRGRRQGLLHRHRPVRGAGRGAETGPGGRIGRTHRRRAGPNRATTDEPCTSGRASTPFMFDDPGENLGPKSNDLWKPVIAAVNGIACGGAFYMLGEVDFIDRGRARHVLRPPSHLQHGGRLRAPADDRPHALRRPGAAHAPRERGAHERRSGPCRSGSSPRWCRPTSSGPRAQWAAERDRQGPSRGGAGHPAGPVGRARAVAQPGARPRMGLRGPRQRPRPPWPRARPASPRANGWSGACADGGFSPASTGPQPDSRPMARARKARARCERVFFSALGISA